MKAAINKKSPRFGSRSKLTNPSKFKKKSSFKNKIRIHKMIYVCAIVM